jgi:hypothetical protein
MRIAKFLFSTALVIAFAVLTQKSQALVVPFTEDFATNNSNWLNGASSSAAWFASGGVTDSGYIGYAGNVTTSGFGPIVFRGNGANDASGDAFVGNWLDSGISHFSAFLRHDAPVDLNFYLRFDKGGGAAASSNPISAAPNTWTELTIPIIDSLGTQGEVFQSYGAAGPTGFTSIFSSIANVQVALSSTQNPSVIGNTYNIGLDRVSVVPEPGAIGLAGGAGLLLLGLRVLRRRKKKL